MNGTPCRHFLHGAVWVFPSLNSAPHNLDLLAPRCLLCGISAAVFLCSLRLRALWFLTAVSVHIGFPPGSLILYRDMAQLIGMDCREQMEALSWASTLQVAESWWGH